MNQLIIICYDLLECLLLHNIFMLKKRFVLIRMALKTLIITKCTVHTVPYAIGQKESNLSY